MTTVDGASNPTWRNAAVHGSSETIVWRPRILLSETGVWLGRSDGHRWVVGRPEGTVGVWPNDTGLSPVWLLILDNDPDVLHDELLQLNGDPSEPHAPDLNSLIRRTIELGLQSRSDHWVERALLWVEASGSRTEVAEQLREVASDAGVKQHSRQWARRLASALREPER
jgi:hypothetical protein